MDRTPRIGHHVTSLLKIIDDNLGLNDPPDYNVRIVDGNSGTKATTRVLIESRDDGHIWRTAGCSTDIMDASSLALADALECWLVVVHDRE